MGPSITRKMVLFCVRIPTSWFFWFFANVSISFLATAFENIRRRLFPIIGMGSMHAVKIRANFGQQKDVPFMYQPHKY